MKVDESHNPQGSPTRVTRGSRSAQGKPGADHRSPAVQTADRVHLSPRARTYARARRQLAALPDIDTEKVREIQHRLKTGRYRLDTDKIAERMIRDALTHDE